MDLPSTYGCGGYGTTAEPAGASGSLQLGVAQVLVDGLPAGPVLPGTTTPLTLSAVRSPAPPTLIVSGWGVAHRPGFRSVRLP
jgi:hypothetical protein